MPIYSDVEFREKKEVENSSYEEKFRISDLVVVMAQRGCNGLQLAGSLPPSIVRLLKAKIKRRTTHTFLRLAGALSDLFEAASSECTDKLCVKGG